MVCVVLKRAGRRVPSPNRICNERVGCDSFTSTAAAACVVAATAGVAAGPGVGAGSAVLLDTPGVGLPSLWPPLLKGVYFFFGCTYFSECCSSFTSTSWPAWTFSIASGARPVLI